MVKIQPAKADGFLSRPPPETRVILLFGPDGSLVADRGSMVAKAFLGTPYDPMAILHLRGPDLKADTARLVDEVCSPSLLGGKRVVRVTEATETLSGVLAELAAKPADDVLVIIEAGDLKPASALRKTAEADPGAVAAIACYPLEAAAMDGFITETARSNGITLDADARQVLRDAVGTDRAVARRQIEKLALYLDAVPVDDSSSHAPSAKRQSTPAATPGSPPTPATIDDIRQCVGESADRSMDDLALAVADGAVAQVGRTFRAGLEQGATTVGILRAVQRHLIRLVPAVDAREAGVPVAKAISEIKPPVFWKHKDRVGAQISRWQSPALRAALDRLIDAEIQCKSTGIPDISLCERTLFQIARLVGRATR